MYTDYKESDGKKYCFSLMELSWEELEAIQKSLKLYLDMKAMKGNKWRETPQYRIYKNINLIFSNSEMTAGELIELLKNGGYGSAH